MAVVTAGEVLRNVEVRDVEDVTGVIIAGMADEVIRVAAVGDLHCTRNSQGAFHQLFTRIDKTADMLLLAGDLTDRGDPDEARVLARELSALHVPVVAVLGNHDFEADQVPQVRSILTESGVTLLDGEACEVKGIGIAGVKGFAGGFGTRALGPWGEPLIKQFVHEAVNEALEAGGGPGTPPHAASDRAAPLLRRYSRRSKANRSKSIRSSDAADSRSPSPGIR